MSGDEDTIIALSSAPGRGGVSLVRVSGPDSRNVVTRLLGSADRILSSPRELVYSRIDAVDAQGRLQTLDYGMGVYFPGPATFTGEDVAEVHLHGSPYLVRRFIESALTLGLRLARPGEFTERAFLNGRIDLVQAEAVADLVHAETESQAFVARQQLEGRLSGVLDTVGEPLRNLLSELEAWIDFPEEELDGLLLQSWAERAAATREQLEKLLATYDSGRVLRDGASVVIVGMPNAGKSSLLNAIVGEERAIVTSIAGTTRDSIEEVVSFDGLPVRLWDTAGVVSRALSPRIPDLVEQLGIEQSWARAAAADLVIFLFDPTSDYMTEQQNLLQQAKAMARQIMVVASKSDLQAADPGEVIADLIISSVRKEGIDDLKKLVAERLVGREDFRGSLQICNARHREALSCSSRHLQLFEESLMLRQPPEIAALELRSALGELDEIVGVTGTEDILGRIFSRFCIGK